MKPLPKNCKTLYYPASGTDFATFFYFAEHSHIKNFYYCDYLNTEFTTDAILNSFTEQAADKGYSITYYADFTPKSFHENTWDAFWHENSLQLAFGKPENAFASIFKIQKGTQSWNLFYFGTEGIKTYKILLNNNIKPDVVIVQDHGLGCFWTEFSGRSYLYEMAEDAECLPRYIVLGLNHEPWPYYTPVSKPFGVFGMHAHARQLFKLPSY